ncbi:universal stress protein [Natrialba aegyptia]|nr:universal stress protein [Natrialba aegyptia]
MQRGLVIADDTEMGHKLLAEAAATARGSDCGLVVLSVIRPESFAADVETLEAIGDIEDTHYDESNVLDAERRSVQSIVADSIDDADLEITYRVSVASEDEHVETVLQTTRKTGCDHLFTCGNQRSPTGKAIFGDRTQQLLLEFPGPVTVALD